MRLKNCIITGGTSGLGLSLVKKFIKNSFFVHIIARDKKKIDKLAKYLNKESLSSFKFYYADISEKNQLNQVLNEIKKLDKIDTLINNAGAMFLNKEFNSKGLEKTLVVNHLSHFFLTTSLINLILKNEKARIINISSNFHKYASLNINDLNFTKKYNGWIAYNNSKLMNLLFNYKINRLYKGKINCYAINPGWLNTNFGNINKSISRYFLNLIKKLFAKNPNKITNKIFDICTNDKYLEHSGKYFTQDGAVNSSNISYNKVLQEKLWEQSLEMIKSE